MTHRTAIPAAVSASASAAVGQLGTRLRRLAHADARRRRRAARRQAVYRFTPYVGTRLIRFLVQRPTGYMSAYTLRGALHDTRAGLELRGERDPIYVSVYGETPVRLPALRGPVAARKTSLRYGTPAEQCRRFPAHLRHLPARLWVYSRGSR